MKKIFVLCILPLLILTSCKKEDLSNYHYVGEMWKDVLNDVKYTFNYSSFDKDGVNLKIVRNNDYIRDDKLDKDIFIYSKSSTFDYVLVDNKKVDEECVNSVILTGIYDVGDNNSAELFIHSSLDDFKGYVKTEICSHPTTSDPMQIIRITLY